MNTPSKLTVGWRPPLTCPRTDEHIIGSLSGTELAGSHGHELVCPGPPRYACLGSHTVALARTRSPRRRRLEQQPAAARGTASRADGGSRRTKPASGGLQASRSRPCGRPTAARSWPVAGERRAVSRTTTAGEPTACARLSFILEYGSRKWRRAPQNSGTGLALGARSCYKQLRYSVFSLIHVAWL